MKREDWQLCFGVLVLLLALALKDCRQRPDAPPWRGDVITQGRRER